MTCMREELLVDISKQLKVMRKQEASHYSVPDYLAPEWQQGLRDATAGKGWRSSGRLLAPSVAFKTKENARQK